MVSNTELDFDLADLYWCYLVRQFQNCHNR